jgi:hypothetical protein
MASSFVINTGGFKTNFDMLFKQMVIRKRKQQQIESGSNMDLD